MKPKSKSESTFETAPKGNFPAVITVIADLGLQESSWKGQTKRSYRIGVAFELQGKKTSEGKPFAVFDTVTYSLHEKARLPEIAESALGELPDPLDPFDLLGKAVLVQVIHREGQDGKTWANVGTVTPLPEGMGIKETETPLLAFDLDNPDPEIFQKLPALFRKKIEARVQEKERPTPADVDLSEDVPI